MNAINCPDKGNFPSVKIMSDSKKILSEMPQEAIHPTILEAIKGNTNTEINGVEGDDIEIFNHPNIDEVIIEETKQLGVHFAINLNEGRSYLTYKHWSDALEDEVLTKRVIAKAFASAWNVLNEMSPLTNQGKLCLSKVWKLQQFLKRSLMNNRNDLKERKNYSPLQNQSGDDVPKEWKDMQKAWPTINWDDSLRDINFSIIPQDDRIKATALYEEILEHWNAFKDNMNELKHKKLPRSNFVYNEHHTEENIKERLIICFSDATGGTKYGMLGAVCYLRVSYAQGGFGWQQLIARTHVAPDKLSIVKRELRALKIGV